MNPRRKAVLWALFALVLFTPPLFWLGNRFEDQLVGEQRTRTQSTLDLHAVAVQESLDRMVGKLEGLEAFVAGKTAEGKAVDIEQFNAFAAGLHASSAWIRAFQIVSDGVVTHTYPLKGNEPALGYNLMADPRAVIGGDVTRALEQNRVTITGPIDLVQGGLGIIIRKPLPRTVDGHARLVAIVFNIAPLLAKAGIDENTNNDPQLAIRRETGAIFFGPPVVFERQPVTHPLSLPDGAWEMGACPLDGWHASASTSTRLFYLAGAIIISLICLLVFSIARRQAGLAKTVEKRTRALGKELTDRKRAEAQVRLLHEDLQRYAGKLEQRVTDRTAQLEAANKELESFSYSVSHDLRAPLRHMDGFSGALLEDYGDKLDDTGRGYLTQVREASREMARLIDDLLELARVTRAEMIPGTVDLSKMARSIVADLTKTDPRRSVVVNIKEGLTVRGDKGLLNIMLTNLLGNAWKFTSKTKKAEITFDSELSEGKTVYFVSDNGAGFDMKFSDKLFGAFQRLHGSHEFEGTGIGLATVQRVINRHGGRVWAEGAVDVGATFYFMLPDAKELENEN